MADRKSEVVNAFETTLAATVNPSDASALLTTISGLQFPIYLALDPDVPGKREIVRAESAIGTTIALSERYLEGSALPSGITHDAGAIVRAVVAAQFVEDLHDRIDALTDHGAHTGLTDDDHTQYLTVARHDTQSRHQPGTSIGTAIAGPSLPGDSNAEGVATSFSRSDHRHSREQHGSAQHAVGTVVPAGTPGSSAPGDAPSAGVATTAARSDHVHGREVGAFVGARVHSSVATVPENVYTPIPWSTEVLDSDGFWTAGAATRFTVPAGKAGKYLVNGQIVLSASTGATVGVRIRKNATTTMAEAQVPNDSNTSPSCVVTSILDLAVGDFITLDALHDFVGADRSIVGGAATPLSFFELVRLGA